MEAVQRPEDVDLATLIDDLSENDADFRRWWTDHNVAVRREGTRSFDHPLSAR